MRHRSRSDSANAPRRHFLQQAGALGLGSVLGVAPLAALAAESVVDLPFGNGERALVKYPQKRPLLRLTARPPQLETPFAVFDENIITPNDAFFVRYHLAGIPTQIDPAKHRISVQGKVATPLSLSVEDLRKNFEPKASANGCRDLTKTPVLSRPGRAQFIFWLRLPGASVCPPGPLWWPKTCGR